MERRFLIVDDSEAKIDFIRKCIKGGPEEIRSVRQVVAYTRKDALQLIQELQDLGAGFIDGHLTDDKKLDGPDIIASWRRIEEKEKRPRAFLTLQSNLYPEGENYREISAAAVAAGADTAISLRFYQGKNPIDSVREVLQRMVPFLLKEGGETK